jgi:hypothetical protein
MDLILYTLPHIFVVGARVIFKPKLNGYVIRQFDNNTAS